MQNPPGIPTESLSRFWSFVETGMYTVLAFALALAAVLALLNSGTELWSGFHNWQSTETILRTIDDLLLAVMLVEILHTVRISIRSHSLVAEPFLIVGLIASIRRMLVITLASTNLTRPETWSSGGESMFRYSIFELAVLGGLVLIFVVAIWLLRRTGVAQESGVAQE